MNKTLFTNGCSWTYGGALDQPDTKERITDLHDNIVWPAHVKRLMNFDEQVNLSAGGGSNQRICRTTFDWVSKQTPETLKNTTAVIQWSCVDRYEYYVPKNNETYEIEPGLPEEIHHTILRQSLDNNAFSITDSRTIDRWAKVNPHGLISYYEDHCDTNILQDANNRYRTYTEQEGLMTWLTQLGFLHDLFNHYEVEHYFWQFHSYIKGYDQPIQDYMYERFPFLEESRDHQWKYERIRDVVAGSNDSHPSEHGHLELAEYIVSSIAKKKTILRKP